MEDNLYSFCGWFISCTYKGSVVTYCELSKTEFFNMIDEYKIFANHIGKDIKIDKVKEDNFLHVNYMLDDYLIGFADFVLIDDEIGVI